MFKLFEMFRKGRMLDESLEKKQAFQEKFKHFQNLLAGNNHALELIGELENVCYGGKPFTLEYVINAAEKLQWEVYDIAEDLDAISDGKYPGLCDAVERIGVDILRELVQKTPLKQTSLTLGLQCLSLENTPEVGGKAASLGEVANRAGLPTPLGFAVTAYACQSFMNQSKLHEVARKILKGLDIEDTQDLVARCQAVREAVLAAPLPEALEKALYAEVDALLPELGPNPRLAVRSSATSEDSEASFAGQHSSVLGVTRDDVPRAYKEVVASTFNPRAVYYRRSKGYPDEMVIMSVLCVSMVDSLASGVLYTRDPNDASRDVTLVNAVWGLGVGAVDGSAATDYFEIAKRDGTVLVSRAADKPTRVYYDYALGLTTGLVPPELAGLPCLGPDELKRLFEYGQTLEEHYGQPLDVEWALDRLGRLLILQARPLGLDLSALHGESRSLNADDLALKFPDNPVLLSAGVTASRGKASGPAYVLSSDHNLLNVPEGAILVAPHTSPRYVAILGRVQGIITEVGSVTGHMASVAREFGVPSLVGAAGACGLIEHGQEITLDATQRLVFKGRVESILERKRPVNPMKGSPTYKAAHTALKKIAVLNLIDPQKDDFTPEGCRTLHDVIRFAHEKSMREMFKIGDELDGEDACAVRLVLPLPMRILAIDLGGGLSIAEQATRAGLEDVQSLPFKAMLAGMLREDVRWVGAVGVDLRGFASIVAQSALAGSEAEERMGGPTYVVLSREYLNFNSRLGYHFAVIDAYVGSQVNDNYIGFSFKGGAADIGRRSRRAQLIARILKGLGFKTEVTGDMTRATLKKYEEHVLLEKLDMLGRLLGSMRLLDMKLSSDQSIDWYVEEFFKGNYAFARS